MAFGIIVYLFLTQNPDILADTVAKIALAIIGGLITLATLIKRKAGE